MSIIQKPYLIKDVLNHFGSPDLPVLPAPAYVGTLSGGVGLAVSSMRHHMTDEGWQLFDGLSRHGYTLMGHGLDVPLTNVKEICRQFLPREGSASVRPQGFEDKGVVLVQDKREWDTAPHDFRDPKAKFVYVNHLKDRDDLFKLTVLKDCQQRPEYHSNSADEMGVHAWVIYYHPKIVKHLCPYVRAHHLVRTYHSIDPLVVPKYGYLGRDGCVLSGAISGAYPLRSRLVRELGLLHRTTHLKHPGYHRNGCATKDYLGTLSRFKVAICTASIYGYALRKIIEATAAGCMVLTDLPLDEVLPDIDENLVRIHPDTSTKEISNLLVTMCKGYDPSRQEWMSRKACVRYDYVYTGRILRRDIEEMRNTQQCLSSSRA